MAEIKLACVALLPKSEFGGEVSDRQVGPFEFEALRDAGALRTSFHFRRCARDHNESYCRCRKEPEAATSHSRLAAGLFAQRAEDVDVRLVRALAVHAGHLEEERDVLEAAVAHDA